MSKVEAAYITPGWLALWLLVGSASVLIASDLTQDEDKSNTLRIVAHSMALTFACIHVAVALHPNYRHTSLAYIGA